MHLSCGKLKVQNLPNSVDMTVGNPNGECHLLSINCILAVDTLIFAGHTQY